MAASPLRAFGAHRTQSPFEGRIDTRRRRALRDQARALPRTPGVYFFLRDRRPLVVYRQIENAA